MVNKRYCSEEIITKLKEADFLQREGRGREKIFDAIKSDDVEPYTSSRCPQLYGTRQYREARLIRKSFA